MTVRELMEHLEEFDGDMEVRLAIQPNWPFEHSISGVAATEEVVYIAEGRQIGYLPGEVREGLQWYR